MNKDFRVSVSFQDHPKTIKLKARKGPEGVLCLLRLWSFAAQYRPTGFLPDTVEDLALAARCEEPVVEAMIEVGFLVAVDGGHEIHDWVEHK